MKIETLRALNFGDKELAELERLADQFNDLVPERADFAKCVEVYRELVEQLAPNVRMALKFELLENPDLGPVFTAIVQVIDELNASEIS